MEAGEVLVEIELATVCGGDLHTVTGSRPAPSPGVLGHEQVGRVVAVGPGEAPRCLDSTPVTPGGFATHCLLMPGTAIAAVDESLPAEVAAPVSCATATVAAVVGAAGRPAPRHEPPGGGTARNHRPR